MRKLEVFCLNVIGAKIRKVLLVRERKTILLVVLLSLHKCTNSHRLPITYLPLAQTVKSLWRYSLPINIRYYGAVL